MVVQRLDHDSDPVLMSGSSFTLLPLPVQGNFGEIERLVCSLYITSLDGRFGFCRSSLLNWAKFKNRSRRGGASSQRTRFLF